MAVNLLGGSAARVDFGDIAAVAGLTSITVSLTVKPSNIANDERLFSQWGGTAFAIICVIIGDELGFAIDGGNLGRQTTDLNLTTGNTYRCVFRWRASAKAMEIWVNGVNRTVASWIDDLSPTTIPNSSAPFSVGRDNTSGVDGIDADYSEFAIHSAYMPDDYCVAYGNGYAPAFFRKNGILYAPLTNSNRTNDLWGGLAGAGTAATAAPHPRIIYPRGRQIYRHAPLVTIIGRDGVADGTSTNTQATGAARIQAPGNAAGTSTNTQAFGQAVTQTQGNAAGTSAATQATGAAVIQTQGSAAGTSTLTAAEGTTFVLFYLRPDADIDDGNWTNELGATTGLFNSIDESSANDSDYVQSPLTSGAVDLTVRLMEGATQIAEWVHSGISTSFVTTTQTLTTEQFEDIVDLSSLHVELEDRDANVYSFALSNPASGAGQPVKVRYRYKAA